MEEATIYGNPNGEHKSINDRGYGNHNEDHKPIYDGGGRSYMEITMTFTIR